MEDSVLKAEDALRAWPYRLGMSVYGAGISAFFSAGGLRWLRRKYETGLDERMGRFGGGVPTGGLWVHSVSVGEVQSALSLIKEARSSASAPPCILSTVTTTGRAMAEKLTLQSVDAMIYSPWDAPRFVRRALDTLRPRAYVAMETERWPTMLAELHARKIPAFLVNGRLSEESAAKLRKMTPFWRGVLSCFDRLMVRFDSDREKFLEFGLPEGKVVVTGDCKVDAMIERRGSADPSRWAHLRNGEAPLFLAGSTHSGEDEAVLEAFARLRGRHPGARLVIVPRHPQRALSVVAASLPYGKVDLLTDMSGDWDVLVVNEIGVLFDLYAAADAAFVGGSLVPKGGQNPMEPALFGTPGQHGPHMEDFPDTYRMDEMGASRQVRDVEELAAAWNDALDPAVRRRIGGACDRYFATVGGGAKRSWEIIAEYLTKC